MIACDFPAEVAICPSEISFQMASGKSIPLRCDDDVDAAALPIPFARLSLVLDAVDEKVSGAVPHEIPLRFQKHSIGRVGKPAKVAASDGWTVMKLDWVSGTHCSFHVENSGGEGRRLFHEDAAADDDDNDDGANRRVWITDSSSNGTYVNGEKLPKGTPQVLQDGARIHLFKSKREGTKAQEIVYTVRLEPAGLTPEACAARESFAAAAVAAARASSKKSPLPMVSGKAAGKRKTRGGGGKAAAAASSMEVVEGNNDGEGDDDDDDGGGGGGGGNADGSDQTSCGGKAKKSPRLDKKNDTSPAADPSSSSSSSSSSELQKLERIQKESRKLQRGNEMARQQLESKQAEVAALETKLAAYVS